MRSDRIFYGKSGRVTVHHLPSSNFVPNFRKIVRPVIREKCLRPEPALPNPITTPDISSPKGENSTINAAILKILTCGFRRKFRDTWSYPKSIILRITNLQIFYKNKFFGSPKILKTGICQNSSTKRPFWLIFSGMIALDSTFQNSKAFFE